MQATGEPGSDARQLQVIRTVCTECRFAYNKQDATTRPWVVVDSTPATYVFGVSRLGQYHYDYRPGLDNVCRIARSPDTAVTSSLSASRQSARIVDCMTIW